MSREIRRVPKNWQHPKDSKGNYIPLYGYSYSEQVKKWDEEFEQWQKGFRRTFDSDEWKPIEDEYKNKSYIEWAGERPIMEDYMPKWSEEEKTHIQMYETCSEGTPISPVMKTPEELARWLADNKASAFGGMTATYEEWLKVCQDGWAPGMMMIGNKMYSGVEALSKLEQN